jgi:hypothetical protein
MQMHMGREHSAIQTLWNRHGHRRGPVAQHLAGWIYPIQNVKLQYYRVDSPLYSYYYNAEYQLPKAYYTPHVLWPDTILKNRCGISLMACIEQA